MSSYGSFGCMKCLWYCDIISALVAAFYSDYCHRKHQYLLSFFNCHCIYQIGKYFECMISSTLPIINFRFCRLCMVEFYMTAFILQAPIPEPRMSHGRPPTLKPSCPGIRNHRPTTPTRWSTTREYTGAQNSSFLSPRWNLGVSPGLCFLLTCLRNGFEGNANDRRA